MTTKSSLHGPSVSYQITGGIPLIGNVKISGSKNAALPLLAATLAVSGVTVLRNVPRLRDTVTMISLLEFLGAKVLWEGNTVTVDAGSIENKEIPSTLVSRLRGSIVLLGPLLGRFGEVRMSYPGGCVLGKRPIEAHISALSQFGVKDESTDDAIILRGKLKPGTVVLPEFSVTASENALIAASLIEGVSTIELAAAEPHVQDTAKFLQACGVEIEGIGSHTLKIHGKKKLESGVTYSVTSDYLEAGAFAIAALVTKGKIVIEGVEPDHLVSFLSTLKRMGAVYQFSNKTLTVDGAVSRLSPTRIQTNIFPGFPTDLQAPICVALTQAEGVSRVFEVLFEGRMSHLFELEKMGARVEILNSHEALILGPTPLRGRQVASNDIRAGATMVLAGLCATGTTIVTDIQYIERGYENFEEKLKKLGAKIEKIS